MIDSFARSFYQKILIDPVLSLRLVKKLSPLKATIIGACFGISTLPLLAFQFNLFAVICLLISGYFDTLDGSLARSQNKTSPQGAVFDIVCDRLVEFSVILGLFMYNPQERALACILMLGSVLICITSFLVVGIFSQNESQKSFHYSPGLMERTEAFVFWIAMILLSQVFSLLAYTFSILVFLTALIRLVQFSKSITKSRNK